MSQSAALIRVAKHTLDGTAIYPHNGQNTIYYQPVDLSSTSLNSTSTTKYLAYTIQRPHEHLFPLASHHMRIIRSMKRLLSNDLSTSPPTKILAVTSNEEEMNNNTNNNNNSNSSYNLNNGHQNGDSNEAKKARIEKSPPSRVIHLRNIDASELEIVQFGLSFGKITNVLNLRKKNQAFLEFDSIEHAQAMTDYFSSIPILLNGRQIFVQFSNHQELKTDPNNANNQQAQAALQSATTLQDIGRTGGQNCVLRVVVSNMIYPVNVDIFHQIFSKFGVVLKIITFTKNDKFQGLIQMKDATTAQSAKLSLNGQNIYNGCCTLQIDFSKLHALNVKYNNDKSRDYTNPTLPSSENTNEPISIGARYLTGIPNVYGSPLMAFTGAPLTTLSTINNGAIHFPTSTATMLNASQLAQQYTTAIACSIPSGTNPTTTLLQTTNTTQSPLSLSTLQQHAHQHAPTTSPYIFLSAPTSSSDEVCGNGGGTGVATGKTATLSSPSALYFYNNNSTPTIAINFSELVYQECLRCLITLRHIKIINRIWRDKCKRDFHCVEFIFYNNTLFEMFFSNYLHILNNLFKIPTDSKIYNTLYIKVDHDNFKELNLTYIQSFMKPNGIDYSYLFFILSSYRKQILLDLETDLFKIPLNGIEIQLHCDKNTKHIYDVSRYKESPTRSNNCVIFQSNNKKKFSTEMITIKSSIIIHSSTKPRVTKTNLLLFIGGILVFSISILCLCLAVYLKYRKWKTNDNNNNQRSSIVSHTFSIGSLDSQKDDISFSEQKKQNQLLKQPSQRGFYVLNNDL
ncbi:unnamed protein product [Rotaria sp. Silwood1]|nr:unnamed protein product [Rotaria sp. Silwood1]CAF1207606.1 unnamed protein product [Rotaria sp. Silwood1]